ncbi:ABC transporter ATP-binding protein [Actinomycetospora rhizophila]|uniref:ABC transporter ATP-binding protein n=1 Tax=Actinomycetospora rhizophila TaxID=1416876 RepID=A0ABV9ZDC7_9PSEU
MPRSSHRLEIRDAERVFGPDAGLFGATLTVAPGEVHALVGLNGSGKTTLMRAALGMVDLHAGGARIDGVPVAGLPRGAWSRVGHMVEHAFAYPDLTVRRNIRLAARLHGLPDPQARRAVDHVLAALDLERYARVRARLLSQGNRQRVGLAAALVHAPRLVVLDEPTNALDPRGVVLVRELLVARAAAGAGVLVSSHHLDEVARVAHRISVLNHGRVIGTLDPGGADLERTFFRVVHADDESRAPCAR